MDHMKLSDELRQQLLESAAWGKAGIKLSPRVDEERVDERGGKKGDEGSGKKKGDTDYSGKGMRKGDESDTKKGKLDAGTEHEDGEDSEELEEAVHVCPLCISQLDEAIDEERILEHLNVVVGLVDRLSQLQEGDEDIETIIDETIQELLFQDLEEE